MLDFLSDIGGLFGAIQPICFALVLVFQYHGAYNFVMSNLSEVHIDEKLGANSLRQSQKLSRMEKRIEKVRHI